MGFARSTKRTLHFPISEDGEWRACGREQMRGMDGSFGGGGSKRPAIRLRLVAERVQYRGRVGLPLFPCGIALLDQPFAPNGISSDVL
jgi:hypothetical protein